MLHLIVTSIEHTEQQKNMEYIRHFYKKIHVFDIGIFIKRCIYIPVSIYAGVSIIYEFIFLFRSSL